MSMESDSELADSIKKKLESLLDLLVNSSKGASVEMLERYYSALQGCIHKQRHTRDKTELVKVCEYEPTDSKSKPSPTQFSNWCQDSFIKTHTCTKFLLVL